MNNEDQNHGNGNGKKFNIERSESPDTLLAIHTRERVCEDAELSNGAARLFTRLLDLALNPHVNNGRKGEIIISQLKLSSLLHCDERSIRRRTDELIRNKYVWTSLVPRPNTKPICCYHITAFQPLRQVRQQMSQDGLWGNGHRRMDAGFSRTGNEAAGGATGQKRRVGSGLVDRFGNPVFANLAQNEPASGQKRPCERTILSAVRGQNNTLPADNFVRSERTETPLPADNFDRSQRTILSAESGQERPTIKESQYEKESSESKWGAAPPLSEASESEIKGWRPKPGTYPSMLRKMEEKFTADLKAARSSKAKVAIKAKLAAVQEELYGPPVADEAPPDPQPAKATRKAPPPTEDQIVEHVRWCLEFGKQHLITPKEMEVWNRREAVAK